MYMNRITIVVYAIKQLKINPKIDILIHLLIKNIKNLLE